MLIRTLIIAAALTVSFFAVAQTTNQTQGHSNELNAIALSYTVNLVSSRLGNATVGQLQTTLTQNNGRYAANSTTKAQGLAAILIGSDLQESCEFTIDQGRALSHKYAGGSKESNDYQVSYDWEERKINFEDGESLDMPPGHIIDLCNMPFAAALLKDDGLAGEVLYVLDGKKKRIRGYKLRSSNQETLETPLGPMASIKIVLEREFNPDRTFSLWLSPDHDYMPIKMEDARSSRTTTFLVNNIET